MKISFSTLACPDFSWSDIYSMAKDLGFHGIEVRGIGDETNALKTKPFSAEKVDKTAEKLRSLKLEIPCLSTGCCLKFADKREENLAEISAHADLAAKLNTPYIRILADLTPAPEGEVDDSFIAEVLKEAAAVAEIVTVAVPIPGSNGRKGLQTVGWQELAVLFNGVASQKPIQHRRIGRVIIVIIFVYVSQKFLRGSFPRQFLRCLFYGSQAAFAPGAAGGKGQNIDPADVLFLVEGLNIHIHGILERFIGHRKVHPLDGLRLNRNYECANQKNAKKKTPFHPLTSECRV